MSAPTFAEARADEGKRQAYLDNFFRENPCDDCEGLIYNLHRKAGIDQVTLLEAEGVISGDNANEARRQAYEANGYAFILMTSELFGKGYRHPLLVNSNMFEGLDEAEAASALKDHEYLHTRDYRWGFTLPGGLRLDNRNVRNLQTSIFEAVVDTRAYRNNIIKLAGEGMMGTALYDLSIYNFQIYHMVLASVRPCNCIEADVIRAQMTACRDAVITRLVMRAQIPAPDQGKIIYL